MRFEEKMKTINVSLKLDVNENEKLLFLCEHLRLKKSELIRLLILSKFDEINKHL